jgi:hypothetical protein
MKFPQYRQKYLVPNTEWQDQEKGQKRVQIISTSIWENLRSPIHSLVFVSAIEMVYVKV